MNIKNEQQPPYIVAQELKAEEEIISHALQILQTRLQRPEELKVTCPQDTKTFLTLKLSQKEHEVFSFLFLDNKHSLIKYQEMFHGTIDGASVYPREVLKAALKHNAAALIIAHNHPSGDPTPSQADEQITLKLKEVLSLVGIRLLDHIIIGGLETTSLAERGVL